jgi:hypothetical protein
LQGSGKMALDADQLKNLLAEIDRHLASPATLCLIGSGATILLGQSARQTDDIDVWARASRVAVTDLRRAALAAGFDFDPRTERPRVPYLQIVHPGIVQVPGWNAATREFLGEPEQEVWRGDKLTVTVPPPRILVASKLLRGDDRDFEDCFWLIAAHALDAAYVTAAVRALPKAQRGVAMENLEILSLMRPG